MKRGTAGRGIPQGRAGGEDLPEFCLQIREQKGPQGPICGQRLSWAQPVFLCCLNQRLD